MNVEAVDTAIEQTIVIIDDEDEIRTLMELALARPGRTVVGFADSSEALAYLRDDRPVDAIISDVRMAGLDGYALVQRLQERGETAGTPVIFVSANDAADHRLAAAGAEIDFLRKPFEIAELRARVDAVVARRNEPAVNFDAILAGAVASAGKNERPMSLLLVATVPALHELSAQRARSTSHSIAGIVRAHLRRSDEAAMLAPYACAASLDGCPPQRAREIASTIAADLRTHSDALGVEFQVGLGCASDCRALTFHQLLGAAQTAVNEAAARADRFAVREVAP
jgi:DNA-binding response OmpR family regulator